MTNNAIRGSPKNKRNPRINQPPMNHSSQENFKAYKKARKINPKLSSSMYDLARVKTGKFRVAEKSDVESSFKHSKYPKYMES